MRHAARRAEQPDAASGEGLGRRHAPGQRKLQHKVRAAGDGGKRARVLFEHRRFAALDEIAAHDADDPAVRSEQAAAFPDQIAVAVMKRVVFTDDPANFHEKLLPF